MKNTYQGEFNLSGFINYLQETFNGFENSFLREVVKNLIEYGLKNNNASKDQFVYWLSDILPEIKFYEVSIFMEDKNLTEAGIEQKRMMLDFLSDAKGKKHE